MKRREFIKITIAASLFVWPLAVRADMPVIGYLSARSPEDTGHLVEAFRRGLSEAGFVEGQNVMVEYRWARGQQDRLPRPCCGSCTQTGDTSCFDRRRSGRAGG
jgi:putative ABC transport system substrate-binding protein